MDDRPRPGGRGADGHPLLQYSITVAGTDRALAVVGSDIGTVKAIPGASAQLWMIDQMTDGSYRVTPKTSIGSTRSTALIALGARTPALARFDPASDMGRWTFKQP